MTNLIITVNEDIIVDETHRDDDTARMALRDFCYDNDYQVQKSNDTGTLYMLLKRIGRNWLITGRASVE